MKTSHTTRSPSPSRRGGSHWLLLPSWQLSNLQGWVKHDHSWVPKAPKEPVHVGQKFKLLLIYSTTFHSLFCLLGWCCSKESSHQVLVRLTGLLSAIWYFSSSVVLPTTVCGSIGTFSPYSSSSVSHYVSLHVRDRTFAFPWQLLKFSLMSSRSNACICSGSVIFNFQKVGY